MPVRSWSPKQRRCCSSIGSEIESHAVYLGHWIELLRESPKVLFQVLGEARQAADLICPEGPLRIHGLALFIEISKPIAILKTLLDCVTPQSLSSSGKFKSQEKALINGHGELLLDLLNPWGGFCQPTSFKIVTLRSFAEVGAGHKGFCF